MLETVKVYLMVLSLVFILKFIFEFIIKFFQNEPAPIQINKYEVIFIYLTISYIITFLITY